MQHTVQILRFVEFLYFIILFSESFINMAITLSPVLYIALNSFQRIWHTKLRRKKITSQTNVIFVSKQCFLRVCLQFYAFCVSVCEYSYFARDEFQHHHRCGFIIVFSLCITICGWGNVIFKAFSMWLWELILTNAISTWLFISNCVNLKVLFLFLICVVLNIICFQLLGIHSDRISIQIDISFSMWIDIFSKKKVQIPIYLFILVSFSWFCFQLFFLDGTEIL